MLGLVAHLLQAPLSRDHRPHFPTASPSTLIPSGPAPPSSLQASELGQRNLQEAEPRGPGQSNSMAALQSRLARSMGLASLHDRPAPSGCKAQTPGLGDEDTVASVSGSDSVHPLPCHHGYPPAQLSICPSVDGHYIPSQGTYRQQPCSVAQAPAHLQSLGAKV